MEHRLSIGLFEPGMTQLHRVGLSGLYMTLSMIKDKLCVDNTGWDLEPDRITLYWQEKGQVFFNDLFNRSFLIDPNGLITFSAHTVHPMGDIERLQLHQSILNTFLQHGKTRKLGKNPITLNFNIDDKQITRQLRPATFYRHQEAAKLLFKNGNNLQSAVDLAGWLFPGGTVRHVGYTTQTKLTEKPGNFLCLLYAPVASLYYRLIHLGPDGKYDKRSNTALVLPHITDMEAYSRCYRRYLSSPVERMCADGLRDAGLMALVTLRAEDSMEELGVNGCTMITMGNVTWSKQQKTRTSVYTLENTNENTLNLFQVAEACLKNRPVVKGDNFFIMPSLSRGLISDNIAAGQHWYSGFSSLMKSKKVANNLGFEKGGLSEMIKESPWPHEADKLFVEAVHEAIRRRYGALASQAKKRGVAIMFDREYERLRVGLTRVKNAQMLRAELAELFSRSGSNKVLQEKWRELLSLFTGEDWQRARDLVFLALASYKGKGIDQIEADIDNSILEE